MSEIIKPSRRRFLLGAGAFPAAPSIVRVANIMPVSVVAAPQYGAALMTATEVLRRQAEFNETIQLMLDDLFTIGQATYRVTAIAPPIRSQMPA